MKGLFEEILTDVLFLGGAVTFAYGLYIIDPVYAWLFSGIFAMTVSALISRKS